ncbi:bifunctional [glutamine synthetase] adenylyltransferase/[glutamine synthetase]-adenylyl-L-tyrosine phosphorylase [Ruania albidiflava]|uniref:bifunctional [glutamine synthetase] adenylyltransferase/[glutamine synthetase]-adenylyl-L-tyrosine phosphorylase n=1 Tax=Ruania albidiflava TaxID=366586 RepID=UPI0003B4BE68|nr:bifunctional [glutamine synthetase] adenylyltransferase/[glutamine synthetase]-adenylyl-L-tyrosine phosphorylase [Ruania albidiflava]
MVRPQTLTGALARAGFADTARAAELLADPALQGADDGAATRLIGALGAVADPDRALLALVRLAETEAELGTLLADGGATGGAALSPADGGGGGGEVTSPADGGAVAGGGTSPAGGGASDTESDPSPRTSGPARLLALLGASSFWGDYLVAHPDQVAVVLDEAAPAPGPGPADAAQLRTALLTSVGADPHAPVPVAAVRAADGGVDELRRAYRHQLLAVAAADLASPDPQALLPRVGGALANLAAAALDGALALARAELADHGAGVRLAVLGMGKTGGMELNYISDVDVVYVAEPVEGTSEEEALPVATKLAATLARMCTMPSREAPLWEVDAALRPEGKNGPLVRTLDSHLAYYRRWAKTWEFQALLKARHVAGDARLSQDYLDALQPMVWTAVEREHFVEDSQAMRRRVEEHVPPVEADRQIKLGRGGLRDVEFTVQLLQLVHGRVDESIRQANTLAALAALTDAGYVGRDHAEQLGSCYRFLRVLEHRVQLARMRRTHLLPTDRHELTVLARAACVDGGEADALLARWRSVRRQVRTLHEDLFYRPLLPQVARLSASDVTLDPDRAKQRLRGIGYRDPAGAIRHISSLTEGVSRRAAIQRQLLPVLLGWFAEGSDPDGALLAFRKISDSLGTTHWYLKLLRDSGAAAERLAHILSGSTFAAERIARLTEAVTWLDDDADLAPRPREAIESSMSAMVARRRQAGQRPELAVRFVRRRELTRAAIADVLTGVPVATCAQAISPAAEVAVVGALGIAQRSATAKLALDEVPSRFLVVAMGRLGGAEIGYGSDADVMFVHDPLPGADEDVAQRWALEVATTVPALLGSTGSEPPLAVDADLRPEGRQGPLVRTLASYAEYYARWAQGWERQALLRARAIGGDVHLGEQFRELIDPLRYPEGGVDARELRELRRIKARVEAERMPRGVPATHHLKLGRGGLADVEWTAQLLQLQHADAHPELQVTGTLAALAAAVQAGLLSARQAGALSEAWELATRLRNANVLATGRTSGARIDQLPGERSVLVRVSRLLGYRAGHADDLEQDWLRAARRARRVMEDVFYG